MAKYTKSELENLIRENRDLSRIDLSNADLSEANLTCVDMDQSYPGNLPHPKLKLSWQDKLPVTRLAYADFSGADLAGVNLTGADLREANLKNTELSGAKLKRANLSYANLKVGFRWQNSKPINYTFPRQI